MQKKRGRHNFYSHSMAIHLNYAINNMNFPTICIHFNFFEKCVTIHNEIESFPMILKLLLKRDIFSKLIKAVRKRAKTIQYLNEYRSFFVQK